MSRIPTLRSIFRALIASSLLCAFSAAAQSQDDRPNILIIWGDDIGMWNLSAYHRGMMGGSTPNIDSIAAEGITFMDHYAQASCTVLTS